MHCVVAAHRRPCLRRARQRVGAVWAQRATRCHRRHCRRVSLSIHRRATAPFRRTCVCARQCHLRTARRTTTTTTWITICPRRRRYPRSRRHHPQRHHLRWLLLRHRLHPHHLQWVLRKRRRLTPSWPTATLASPFSSRPRRRQPLPLSRSIPGLTCSRLFETVGHLIISQTLDVRVIFYWFLLIYVSATF